jgi:hypothetical protein
MLAALKCAVRPGPTDIEVAALEALALVKLRSPAAPGRKPKLSGAATEKVDPLPVAANNRVPSEKFRAAAVET